jgi:nucleoside-diphosphate-sugar epimerase
MSALPARFENAAQLEDLMTTPSPALIEDLAATDGDLIVLGVGGKMGPTLARLAKRAAPTKRVIGVARFSEPGLRARLEAADIECIETDLLDRVAVARLPKVANVIFMAGRKFGSTDNVPLTWAMNALVPAYVAEAYANSRIIVFSTACVYAFAPINGPGANEAASLTPPGEYANSCVARERVFEHFSRVHGTRGRLIRLSYAIDMRYGVLHDIARKLIDDAPIDLAMAAVNVIWQGDANTQILRSLRACTAPMSALNVSGGIQRVRDLATGLGKRLGRTPRFAGREADDAWVIDCSAAGRLFGAPSVSIETLLDWTADWVARGGPSLGKETHFETRDGSY